ncbi:MAG TPA: hypothetical protein DCE41_22670, partial [Cytophagales bacterium]|nr:hypothetical protein [Cytophagales bacterium]
MTWFIPTLPLWVSILFLLVIPLPIYLIARLMSQGATAAYGSPTGQRVQSLVLVGYALFLAYATWGWSQGWYAEPGLPPRILLYTTLPLLAVLLPGVFPWRYYRQVAQSLPVAEWVRLHRFRFIGSFFLLLFLFGELPPLIGIVAGTGDIL